MENLLSQAYGQDVSKLAAEEKQLLLSRLLAHLAHEIRNPLSSLDIHVQLLIEDLDQAPPEVRNQMAGRLDVIRGELHRLESVVRHFGSLAGPSLLDVKALDVRPVVEHVRQLLFPEAAARGIGLSAHVPSELPAVRADPVRLTQALLNVVINALQAVERNGQVEIRLGIDVRANRLLVSVADDGPGIPADKHSAIFEPFFTTKTGGGGLGLWIVQQIVLAHGGGVSVGASRLGGAVVTLALPLPPGEVGLG